MSPNIPKSLLNEADKDSNISGYVNPDSEVARQPILSEIGEVVGFFTPRKEKDYIRVGAMYVKPEHRNKGLAAKAISKYMAGKTSKALVEDTNIASAKALQKAGFKKGNKSTEEGMHWYTKEASDTAKVSEAGIATKTNPELWSRAKSEAKARMGGKHSARAMQLATKIYKDRGGDYAGKKPSASQNKMRKWTKQDWQTRPGTSEIAEKSDGRTSRYLPKAKWDSLSKSEQKATDAKKLKSDSQYVDNTEAAKVKGSAKYIKKSEAEFKPDISAEDLKAMGVYDQVYGDAESEASMEKWPAHWLHEQDPLGWLQWYERYSNGRRTEDDARQIKRWASFKARHGSQYTKNPTPRRKAALRNWGIDADRLIDNMEKQSKVLTTRGRDRIKEKNFALDNRRYPIHDINHARAALSMVAKHGTTEEQAQVRQAVYAKYPGIANRAKTSSLNKLASAIINRVRSVKVASIDNKALRVAILNGSTGEDSKSRALADAYAKHLMSRGAEVDTIDMRDLGDLPDVITGDATKIDPYLDRFSNADAFVVSSPIYNWGPSGKVHHFLDLALDSDAMKYKPYSLLSGAGSNRSALAMGDLANRLNMELKGIGIGAGVQVTPEDFKTSGQLRKSILNRASENADMLLRMAKARKQVDDAL